MSVGGDERDPEAPAGRLTGCDGLLARSRRSPGADTRAIVAGISALDPAATPLADAPAIPGLVDLAEVGRGGMGIVYRARETRLGRVVAVKVLAAGIPLTDEGRLRAEREAVLLTRVVHPNIVHILYVTDVAGTPAIVMEWIDGPSLEERHGREAVRPQEAAAIVADLARGVAALHAAGIIHRDIKPANVLLARTADGVRPVPKLVDFGLARSGPLDGPSVTNASVAVGTPSFMAPEQTGLDPTAGPVGPAADIHCLGGVLYWLLSGRAPFDAESSSAALRRAARGDALAITALVDGLPADLGTIVGRCLEPRPADRYPSAAALAEDLQRFLDHRPILARPASPLEQARKWVRRRPAVAALMAVSLAAALVTGGGVVHHLSRVHAAAVALRAGRQRLVTAEALARRSFERLIDASAERFLARGGVLDEADRDHLRRIRDEYLSWPLGDDPGAGLRFRAAGLVRLARIFERLHWGSDALESTRGAVAILDEVARMGGTTAADDTMRLECSRRELALLARSGRTDEALQAARREVSRLEEREASDPTLRAILSMACGDLANVESQSGNVIEARYRYRLAIELSDAFIAADRHSAQAVTDSLPLLYNAAISPAMVDRTERRHLFEKLVARSRDGLARFREGRESLGRGLLLGLSALVALDLDDGRADEALRTVRTRESEARALAAEMPDSDYFHVEMAGAAAQAGHCLAILGRREEADEAFSEAVGLAADVVADRPAVAAPARALVEALLSRGGWLAGTGRTSEATRDFHRVVEVLTPWMNGGGGQSSHGFGELLDRARTALDRLADPRTADTR